ncbi:hypothetical protein PMI22_01577 [Pseudomonas sp. GM21]|uniref:hypothetical protein n=1 Tax=Pseudomonas sp. GM21 TaxID=1144325 RepID=UPI0002727A47|nr:hypothetical protein [Pseudomonas sp. GM21]EJM22461.1 hypothetical protein PMI22_01577 [Pseudomonas sp. GM21]
MSKNRLFGNKARQRLIVSVETAVIEAIDRLIHYPYSSLHTTSGPRSPPRGD